MSFSETVLVTAGAGFIGSNLEQALGDAGAKVRIIDNLSTGFVENLEELSCPIDFTEGCITDGKLVAKILEDVDMVFHQAALPSVPRSVENPEETHEMCVNGTFNLLNKSRMAGVKRFIYAASSSAYGDQPTLPKTESMSPSPMSPYAAAKLMGEYYCKVFSNVYGIETVSLRYFNVFGPRQNPSSQYSGVISRFIDSLMKEESPIIYGDGEHSRDFTFIANVVNANMKAAQTANVSGLVLNCANGERISLNELLKTLQEITGKHHIQARYEKARVGDVKHSQADNSLAIETIGYEKLVGLEEGLMKTMEWWASSRFSK
jgi:nucleoside-diphosphate-sugar epimerase